MSSQAFLNIFVCGATSLPVAHVVAEAVGGLMGSGMHHVAFLSICEIHPFPIMFGIFLAFKTPKSS